MTIYVLQECYFAETPSGVDDVWVVREIYSTFLEAWIRKNNFPGYEGLRIRHFVIGESSFNCIGNPSSKKKGE